MRDETDRLNERTEQLRSKREKEERERTEREEKRRKEREVSDARNAHETNYASVQASIREYVGARERASWIRAKLDYLNEVNHKFRDLTANQIVGQLIWVAAPMAVAVLDAVLLSPAGREITKNIAGTFGGGASLTPFAIVAVAISYILLELIIGFNVDGERRGGGRAAATTAYAIVAWITLPLSVVLFSLVNSGVFSASTMQTMGRSALMAALFTAGVFGLMASVTHGFVLFFGGRIVKGYGYLLYKLQQLWFTGQLNRLATAEAGGPANVGRDFRKFYRDLESDQTGVKQQAGPIPARERKVVNEVFDSEVIEDPPRKTRSRPDPAPFESGVDDDTHATSDGEARQDHDGPKQSRETHETPDGNGATGEKNGGRGARDANPYNMEGEDELRSD
ncbi:MAG: hypothetical protein JO314_13250 [Acidobacteria bacterium]|nr:hypothetical protein [Acidobacteriota bacterium]